MRYMLLFYGDERSGQNMTPRDREASVAEWFAYIDAMKAAGVYQAGDPLEPTRNASTVRIRSGKTLTTDGPFAETKEQLGGYCILELPDLDQALAWAARCPGARDGSVEVRPFRSIPRPGRGAGAS